MIWDLVNFIDGEIHFWVWPEPSLMNAHWENVERLTFCRQKQTTTWLILHQFFMLASNAHVDTILVELISGEEKKQIDSF